jgi:hypothetical protein
MPDRLHKNRLNFLGIRAHGSSARSRQWNGERILAVRSYATLVKEQRVLNDIALGEFDLQRKLDLATQSQLMREAVDAFAPT